MITDRDVQAYLMAQDDDDLCYEGPPLFCGNSEARAKAMAEASSVPEFIAAGHAYNRSPEGEAYGDARRAARLQRLEAAKAKAGK